MNELTAAFKEYATGTLLVLDLIGTFVFALSGAVVGVKRRLDIFGVLVISFAAASAGGIMRDLLIDSVPPAAIRDWRYMATSVLAGLLIFVWLPRSRRLSEVRSLVLLFDAAGLGLFAVTGTQKALGYGLHPAMAPLLGMLTGIGGGMLRDILVAEIPNVLRADLYAVAALAGAVVVVVGHLFGMAPLMAAVLGALICFSLRLIAIRRGWQLPVADAGPNERIE
ncbi:MAG TPA: trimeric intracellular cation channel family protein [Pyrinomonadaceae bacterium]|nr:trimeric intracellular cation channel family protein [Pyrinomonadaceae bacterium]